MRRPQIAAAILSLFPFIACLAGCVRTSVAENSPRKSPRKPTEKKRPAAVALAAKARKKPPRTTTQPARIEAYETTHIYAKVAGYVARVHVDIGDEITDLTKPLISLRIPEMKDVVTQKSALETQAKREVEQAAAAVEVAKSRKKSADAQVDEATAGVPRYVGGKKRWDAELARLTKLARDGSVTEKLVDEARYRKDTADAALLEAKARMVSAAALQSSAAAGVTQSKADKKAAEARQQVAAANLMYAKTMRDYAVLNAPFPGVIIERNADTGHFVQPGDAEKSKPLLIIAQTKTVRVVVEIPEADALFVRRGNTATVRVPSLGRNGSFAAKVSRTSFALNPRNRTLRVEIDISNPTGRLRPGMYATATIELSGDSN